MNASSENRDQVREVVAVFRDAQLLERATRGLLKAGFVERDIDIMADKRVIEDAMQRDYVANDDRPRHASGLETHFDVIHESPNAIVGIASTLMYLGATAAAIGVVASGGAIAVAAAAAAAGALTGGGLSALLVKRLGWLNARQTERDLESGGIIVMVRARTSEREAAATAVLKALDGENVRVQVADGFGDAQAAA